MESIEHLINRGLYVSEKPDTNEPLTVIVLGVGRGGTSLCSTALASLGIFTGENSKSPVFEDIPLSKAIENRDFHAAKTIIEKYNSSHDIWAFKRPTTNDSLSEMHGLLRNPSYIVIFRDLLAISLRNQLSMGASLFATIRESISNYQKIVNFLETTRPPALYASYEKTLNDRSHFIDTIIDFLSLNQTITEKGRQKAIESIKPSPREYLVNTSTVKFYGYLDSADRKTFSGWAAFDKTNEKLSLGLYLNHSFILEFSPNDYRDDIRQKGLHPNGNCGFSLNYPHHIQPKAGDLVSVRFKKTGAELRNSPITIT